MNFFKIFFVIAFVINAILVAYFMIFDTMSSVINLEIATISSIAILSATYFGYKKLIESKLSTTQPQMDNQDEDEDENEELSDEKPSTLSAVAGSYKGYLFPMRLVAYGVFVGSFIYLSDSGSLEIAAFFAGLSVAPISVLIAMAWLKKTKMEVE